MKTPVLVVISLLVLSACASSGISPTENDTYTISKTSAAGMFGNTDGVKNDIYVEANAFCSDKAKAVQTVNVQTRESVPGRLGSATLIFRCVKAGPRESDQCFKNLADDAELAGVKDKVALISSNDQTFSMLSDNSKPSAKEKDLLKVWGGKRDVCIKMNRADMQEERLPLVVVNLRNSYLMSSQVLIANLVNGDLTYSAYAAKRQELTTFSNEQFNKITTELRKDTQESHYKAEQLAIEAQKNELLNQKIQSDRDMQQRQIQSNEKINQQQIQNIQRSNSQLNNRTTTDCRKNGGVVSCSTY